MKLVIVNILFLLVGFTSFSQGVVISATLDTPDETAILEVKSAEKGLLIPRMTTAQRDAILTPARGLTIYNTETKCLEWWNGTNWFGMCD